MGMDVYGKNPTSEKGEYFRNNVWWWRPLWDYCEEVYEPCNLISGHSNDGDGLDADGAAELASVLFEKLESGETQAYATLRQGFLESLPDNPCDICKGTGQRPDGLYGVEWKQEGCNGCGGTGKVRPFEANYPFDTENVREFAEFCAASGGFEIC